jgi:ribosome-associated translation inhibitor RaiA
VKNSPMMEDLTSGDLSFENLSTEAMSFAEKKAFGKGAAGKKAPPAQPKVDPKTVADVQKHAQRRTQAAIEQASRPRVLKKITKLEQYFTHFGSVLKGQYKKLTASATEAEVDLQLEQVQTELNSQGSSDCMQAAWILGSKLLEIVTSQYYNPLKLKLDEPVSLADVASSEQWIQRVNSNLIQIQIKYGLFQHGPESALLMQLISMVVAVHKANNAMINSKNASSSDFNSGIDPKDREQYSHL